MTYADLSLAHSPTETANRDLKTWKPLRFFNLFRFLIAGLFLQFYLMGPLPPPLGHGDPKLFFHASLLYLAFGVASMVAMHYRRPRFSWQLYTAVAADIVFLTLLMHASGGIGSGLGMLLVISVANASMVTEGRTARLFAALASIALLVEQTYAVMLPSPKIGFSYPHAGMLGATLFATAILAHVLARRARESEALAAQREVDLANMAQLTGYIIQHMDTGVLVVDAGDRVRLMNTAARTLLPHPPSDRDDTIGGICPDLGRRLAAWQQHRHVNPTVSQIGDHEVLPRFAAIGSTGDAGTLIFLEDATRAAHQAQQLKLASLGRLTASIAHEIRNPLGAISHAAQLLGESPKLEKADARLVEIILQHSQRMNTIIENVLQLGRRDRSRPTRFVLLPWLERFLAEFRQATASSEANVFITAHTPEMEITFDPNHLHQILWNLCQNALRHAGRAPGEARVELEYYPGQTGHPIIEVHDFGPGVPASVQRHIFEPFFTTEAGGTGLGLYIARELAECNQARLRYQFTTDGGSRFRLSLPAQEEWQID